MTERRGGRDGSAEAGSLSEEDVERRLEGGAGVRVMHVHARTTSTRRQVARDTAIILGGALLAIVVGSVVGGGGLGDGGPGTSEAIPTEIVTRSEGPSGSLVAIATLPPPSTVGPVVNPSLDLGASPTPVPIETLPPTTVTVVVRVRNDQGGNDIASDWLVSITGAHPSKSSFAGSATGTRVTIDGLKAFEITTTPKTVGGYSESMSTYCSGPVPKGLSFTCTITEKDKPVKLAVSVVIKTGGTLGCNELLVKVIQGGSTHEPPPCKAGSIVTLRSNQSWKTTTSPTFDDYDRTMSKYCTHAAAREGLAVSCTITFTYNPAPTPSFGPVLPLLPLRRRRRAPPA